MKPPFVDTWCGTPIDELSHEELLAAFRELAALYQEANQQHLRDLNNLFPLKEFTHGQSV